MEKMIHEMPMWRKELSKKEYDEIFMRLVNFMGTVPTIPNAIRGIDEPDEVDFYGGFDKISVVLQELGKQYPNEDWLAAGDIFMKGRPIIQKTVETIVDYLIGKEDHMNDVCEYFKKIEDIMIKGYRKILLVCDSYQQ